MRFVTFADASGRERPGVADDEYVRQLDRMDVDIVAYQDEVGVRKSKTTETAAFGYLFEVVQEGAHV